MASRCEGLMRAMCGVREGSVKCSATFAGAESSNLTRVRNVAKTFEDSSQEHYSPLDLRTITRLSPARLPGVDLSFRAEMIAVLVKDHSDGTQLARRPAFIK